MQGIFDFEFIGNFFYKLLTLRKITIFRQIRKPPDFVPAHFDLIAQSHRDQNFGAVPPIFGLQPRLAFNIRVAKSISFLETR